MKKLSIIAAVLLLAAGCNSAVKTPEQKTEEQTQVYQGSYVTGYEGDFLKVKYSLDYLPSKFQITNPVENGSEIDINESGAATHIIKIFYNGAAGFENSADYWKNVGNCKDCKEIDNHISIGGAKDMHTYEGANTEYVVFAHDPGFVQMIIRKPYEQVVPVLESLKITTEKANNPLD